MDSATLVVDPTHPVWLVTSPTAKRICILTEMDGVELCNLPANCQLNFCVRLSATHMQLPDSVNYCGSRVCFARPVNSSFPHKKG